MKLSFFFDWSLIMAKRGVATREDFLRVAVTERAKFVTSKAAAGELGLTEASFKQRLKRERELYPQAFEGVEVYPVKPKGRTVDSTEDVMAMLSRLAEVANKRDEADAEAAAAVKAGEAEEGEADTSEEGDSASGE